MRGKFAFSFTADATAATDLNRAIAFPCIFSFFSFLFFFLGNGVDFHDLVFLGSSTSRRLANVGELAASSDILIRLHGALMLASWIGTASIGMLLARYYRQTWVNSQLCGKDHWFAVSMQFLPIPLTWVFRLINASRALHVLSKLCEVNASRTARDESFNLAL